MKIGQSRFGHERSARNRIQGFTLMEVVMAVLVIVVAFVALFGTFSIGLKVTQLSQENLRATQILLDKTEGLRLYSWTQLTNSSFLVPTFTNWFYETNNIGLANAQGNGVMYTGLVQVLPVPFTNLYSTNMVQINVTAGWTSTTGGSARTVSMSTYVGQQGMQNYVY